MLVNNVIKRIQLHEKKKKKSNILTIIKYI